MLWCFNLNNFFEAHSVAQYSMPNFVKIYCQMKKDLIFSVCMALLIRNRRTVGQQTRKVG